MKKILTFSVVALFGTAVVFSSCKKKDKTQNYTCNCTIVQSVNGTPLDTVTENYTINTTQANAQSACASNIQQNVSSGGMTLTQSGSCTFH